MNDPVQSGQSPLGTVHLVGAGPGDPDLLTVRALELLRAADLVLYDNLTSAEIVALAGADAERRYVGKKRADHALEQAEINRMMVTAARGGKAVVRLKGGDPYVFGRGGEEAQAMAEAGVPFEVVPGVTSALGAAAYAGMPLTHRDHTQAVTMLTGHDVESIDWTRMAGRQTLVVFMGLTTLAEIAARLVKAGLDPETPSAAIRWVTRGDQEVVVGTLDDLPGRVAATGLKPPSLVIIGDIVKLRPEVDWFDSLPLRGRRVVVTRAESQAASLCRGLRRLGAEVVPVPVIAFEPPSSWAPVDDAVRKISAYDWLVFTSVNGVEHFLARLEEGRRDFRDLPANICAIGSATAERLNALHLRVDLVPERFVAESLGDAFEDLGVSGRRVLLPRAEEARDFLPNKLAALGAAVDVVPVYRTVLPVGSPERARRAWCAEKAPDWVTLTSSSTARNLASLVPLDDLQRSRIVSIGPVTSATAREIGLQVAAEASPHTAEGLVQALRGHASGQPDGNKAYYT